MVGTTEEVESEGFDRATLDLPGRQDELVRRVAAANPRTVVVVNTGAPVLLPWADTVPAVLLTLFPGQEYGNALADVLLGHCEPGGRLPVTWPEAAADLPATMPEEGVLAYAEGLHIAIPLRRLAHWDTATGGWQIEPGEFQLGIGRSSRGLPLPVTVTVGPGTAIPDGSRC